MSRFTQPDPSGQEANNYLYAAANPCNNTDPTGAYTDARGDAIGGVTLTVGCFALGLLTTGPGAVLFGAVCATAAVIATVGGYGNARRGSRWLTLGTVLFLASLGCLVLAYVLRESSFTLAVGIAGGALLFAAILASSRR